MLNLSSIIILCHSDYKYTTRSLTFTYDVFTRFKHIFALTHAGLDKIEFLQNHENQDIYQKAFDIIERYFGSEEEDPGLAPTSELGVEFNFRNPQSTMAEDSTAPDGNAFDAAGSKDNQFNF